MTSIYRSDHARQAVEDRYRTFLAAWPEPSAQITVPTRQGDTFVIVHGPEDAPPLVLLHGAGFNSTAWLGDVEAWGSTHRTYGVDLIGEPGLSAPARPPLNSPAYAEWLDDVLAELGIGQAALVGSSLGGWIALDYALRRPERVGRLSLLVPGGIGSQKYGALLGSALLVAFGDAGKRAATRIVLGPQPRSEASRPRRPRSAQARSDQPRSARAKAAPSHAEELADYLRLIQRSYLPRRDRLPMFSDDQLRQLGMPLQYIAGAKDRMLNSGQAARRLRESRPDAQITLLPGVGHIPIGYTQTVHQFLTGQ